MQAENPCSNHEDYQITSACLKKDCQLSKIFCDVCLKNHDMHYVIKFQEFTKKYKQFQEVNQNKINQIKKLFEKVKQTFLICIKKAQQRVLKEYIPCSGISLPKIDSIQIQQLWGIASQVCKDQKFINLATGVNNITKFNEQQNKNVQFISTYIDQLNTGIMASINKFMSQIQMSKISKSPLKQTSGNYFNFTQKYLPKIFQISDNGQTISRNSTINEGLSMYAVLDNPLSKQVDTINFKIIQQQKRFIYFGVCDAETFKIFNFKGSLYQKGNKMYSIRQSTKQGLNAICLHNSLEQYSNKDKVPWDFALGDIISIKYNYNKNFISFIKNEKQIFQMPLDKTIKNFYPFVGLKFNKDKVKIVPSNNSGIFEKKKGIFESFISSIK